MSNLRDIRLRIRGVKSTQKITRSMQMVAATRMRRAQKRAVATRPFARALADLFADILGTEETFSHPLAEERKVKNETFVIFSSDRGLCGSFNHNLFRQIVPRLRPLAGTEKKVSLIPIGRKGLQFFKRRGYDIALQFTQIPSDPTSNLAELIVQNLLTRFETGKTDAVWLVYNQFISPLIHEPVAKRILPIQKEDLLTLQVVKSGATRSIGPERAKSVPTPFLFEPGRDSILAQVLPHYLNRVVLQAFLESTACEYSARMTAMDQATRNAEEMIQTLTLLFNKVRQTAITKEILEVVGGAEALTRG